MDTNYKIFILYIVWRENCVTTKSVIKYNKHFHCLLKTTNFIQVISPYLIITLNTKFMKLFLLKVSNINK